MTDKVKQVKAFANDTLDKKNYLNNQDIKNLMKLFDAIKLDLSDTSFPTRTNRLEAVENMAKVLEIHGWKCIRDPLIWEEPSKSQEKEMTAEELSSDKHQGREDY